jgi:surface protein
MSTRNILGNTTAFKALGNRTTPPIPVVNELSPSPWVRPADWLTLPELTNSDNRMVGLHAIWPESNFIALNFTVTGGYTVDWGDGTIQTFSSGSTAQYEYNFNTISNATLTSEGFRQVIIQVYPTTSGQSFTASNLHVKHSKTNLSAYVSGFLDISIAGPILNSLLIGSSTASASSNNIYFSFLQQVRLYNNVITNMGSLFNNCYSLVSLPVFNTSSVTNMSRMFDNCTSLTTSSLPVFNTSNVTNMTYMFNGCTALTTVPLFNTINVIDMGNMFIGCTALRTVPLFNTTKVTSMTQMFTTCRNLTSVPLFNTTKVTTMFNMFNACSALTTVPLFDTINVIDMGSMFVNCTSLITVPKFDAIKVVSMSGMFSGCSALTSAPSFKTRDVTNTSSMFSNCRGLTSVQLFDTSKVTNMTYMFNSCSSLLTVPLFNTSSATDMGNMFNSCSSLLTVPLFDMAKNFSTISMFQNCKSLITIPAFNTPALVNPGSMFSGCSALTSVPLFKTTLSQNFFGMFSGCTSLRSVPLFDTSNAVTTQDMFSGCRNLTIIPPFDTKNVTGPTGMFTNCTNLSDNNILNINVASNFNAVKYSSNSINKLITNLYGSATTRTCSFSTNHGADVLINRTGNTTLGSNIINNFTNTSGLSVGMAVISSAMSYTTSRTLSIDADSDTLTHASHGLANNTPICFNQQTENAAWVSRITTTLASHTWSTVAFGVGSNGPVLVAGSSSSSIVGFSYDQGLTWSTIATSVPISQIAYGNGVFLGIRRLVSSTLVYSSTDGINWTSRTVPSATYLNVTFGNGRFVITTNGTTIISSSDLITWHSSTIVYGIYHALAFGGGRFVTMDNNGSLIGYTSTDGVTWTAITVNLSRVASLAYGNNMFFGVIGISTTSTVPVTSFNGIDWFSTYTLPANGSYRVVFGDGLFMLVSEAASTGVITTANGSVFNTRANLWASQLVNAQVYANNRFVSVTSTSNVILQGPTNLDMSKTYYTRDVATNTFKISLTSGGPAVNISSSGTASSIAYRAGSYITAITPNTSITLSAPAVSTLTGTTISFRTSIDTMPGLMKNWTVTI